MDCPNFLANSLLGGWIGCNDPNVMTAAQQVANMRSNFGAAANPALVDTAVNDFAQYLDTSGYQTKIDSLTAIDNQSTVGGWFSGILVSMHLCYLQ